MTTAAIAGPISRPAWMIEAFSETALTTRSRPTISVTKLCRAGLSNVLITPRNNTSDVDHPDLCVAPSRPRPRARPEESPGEPGCRCSSLRFDTRSATRPPQSADEEIRERLERRRRRRGRTPSPSARGRARRSRPAASSCPRPTRPGPGSTAGSCGSRAIGARTGASRSFVLVDQAAGGARRPLENIELLGRRARDQLREVGVLAGVPSSRRAEPLSESEIRYERPSAGSGVQSTRPAAASFSTRRVTVGRLTRSRLARALGSDRAFAGDRREHGGAGR